MMKIQRFDGRDSQEALGAARAALGPDAVILHTRTVRDAGPLGLARRPRVEVLAAVDFEPTCLTDTIGEWNGTRTNRAIDAEPLWRRELGQLRDEMARLNHGRAAGPATTPEVTDLARRVRRNLRTGAITLRPGRCVTVAFVGPTGVGKTTTLAKIAAAAVRTDGLRVGLLTTDTYRVGAVEQLQTYANLLDVPLFVAANTHDVVRARSGWEDLDLVLVDTTGRAPARSSHLGEQAALLEAARLDECHLCIDAGSPAARHASVLHAFGRHGVTHLLLTKLDEADALSDALESALRSQLPLSYVGVGQGVPEDLCAADADQLAAWLVEGL